MIRNLAHPGPATPDRFALAPCHAEPVTVTLPPADTLAQSAALALADYDGGWLVIEDVPLANLDIVIPGEDPTGAHAAWYAGPYQLGAGTIRQLGMHVGRKDGAPWVHGHGSVAAPDWKGPDFGHVMPLESRLSRPVTAKGWAIRGARLEVMPDPETAFPLFQPHAVGPRPPINAALLTLRPNQDLIAAIESAAASAGMTEARILGLGSVVHPKLQGKPRIDSFATELLVTEGRLAGGVADLDIDLITLGSTRHNGRLARGANGICITAELLLVAR